MNGLLHSKRFRKNLSKWLCMYVGAILLLTTVITYSKYISSFGFGDKARVTKFDVEVINVTTNVEADANNVNNVNIDTGVLVPGKEITYDFNIDYEFEVKTEFVLVIDVDSNFEVLSILEDDIEIKNGNNRIQKSETIEAGLGKKTRKYSVKVKYKENGAILGNTEIVKVYYKAQQIYN